MRFRRWMLTLLPIVAASARADQFDAIEGKALAAALKGPEVRAVERLNVAELGALPNLLKDARGDPARCEDGQGESSPGS